MLIACENPEAVAKRAFWLAYQAAGVFGMGHFQANDSETEDSVWKAATWEKKPFEAYGDYVAGRMMKLTLRWNGEGVSAFDATPRADYQSWCGKYPTYESLVNAAIVSLK